jgi:tRNA modification GTPase
VNVSVRGLPMRLIDTAGLRETVDPVERLGVDRAQSEIESADILLWMGAPSEAPKHPRRVLLHAKADFESSGPPPPGTVSVSSMTGDGVDELLEVVSDIARTLIAAEGEVALNRRQAGELTEAWSALRTSVAALDLVVQAEWLRVARSAFDRLTGRAAIDDLLDAMFSRFCLGK